jgi:hypothetical protein
VTIDKTFKLLVLAAALAVPSAVAAQDGSSSSTGTSTESAAAPADAVATPAAPDEAAPGEAAPGEAVPAEAETPPLTTAAPSTTTEPTPTEPTPTEPAPTEPTSDGTALAAPAEDDASADEPAAPAPAPLAWRNSFFSWTQGLSFNSLTRDGQQTYDPNYYWAFSLIPRWYLEPRLFLVASLGVSYELTDSNFDTYNREVALSDGLIELRYTAPVDRFVFIPAVRLTFPTSKASQAAQRYFNTGIGLTTVLQIPEFLGSNLALGLAYRRWWAGSNVSLAMGDTLGAYASTDPAAGFQRLANAGGSLLSGTDSMGGPSNAADRILTALTFNMAPAPGLTLTLQGLWIWDRVYDNPDAFLSCDRVLTTTCDSTLLVEQSADQWRWRWFTYYTLAAAYDVQPWLNLQLGVANAAFLAPFFNDDGSVRSPFNPDTQVYLSTTITLDGLYETLTAGSEDDGLSPEERQRRRQGLASLEDDLLRDILGDDAEGDDDSERPGPAAGARSTAAF